MNSTAAADRLNISAKKLRRVLRNNPDLVTKVDGKYFFTEEHIATLADLVRPASPQDDAIEFLDSDEPMTIAEVSQVWSDRAIRARATSQYRARQARLMARMTEVGVA